MAAGSQDRDRIKLEFGRGFHRFPCHLEGSATCRWACSRMACQGRERRRSAAALDALLSRRGRVREAAGCHSRGRHSRSRRAHSPSPPYSLGSRNSANFPDFRYFVIEDIPLVAAQPLAGCLLPVRPFHYGLPSVGPARIFSIDHRGSIVFMARTRQSAICSAVRHGVPGLPSGK